MNSIAPGKAGPNGRFVLDQSPRTPSIQPQRMSTSPPQVFISATSGDLRRVRQVVKDALLTINCMPVERRISSLTQRRGTLTP